MPNTPMTCNPHRTTKTARVWNNAIRRPACGYARQSMSLYPNPKSLFSSFLGQQGRLPNALYRNILGSFLP